MNLLHPLSSKFNTSALCANAKKNNMWLSFEQGEGGEKKPRKTVGIEWMIKIINPDLRVNYCVFVKGDEGQKATCRLVNTMCLVEKKKSVDYAEAQQA